MPFAVAETTPLHKIRQQEYEAIEVRHDDEEAGLAEGAHLQ